MSALYTQCPGNTVQTGTRKVDLARKFKCTTAARGTENLTGLGVHWIKKYNANLDITEEICLFKFFLKTLSLFKIKVSIFSKIF